MIVHSNRFMIVKITVIFLIMKIERPHKISEYFVIITFYTCISSLTYQQQHVVYSINTLVYLLIIKILSYITRNAFHYYFTIYYIRLLWSSVDHDSVAMASY